jgi:hypothetical protein
VTGYGTPWALKRTVGHFTTEEELSHFSGAPCCRFGDRGTDYGETREFLFRLGCIRPSINWRSCQGYKVARSWSQRLLLSSCSPAVADCSRLAWPAGAHKPSSSLTQWKWTSYVRWHETGLWSVSYPCNRPWRPIVSWDVENPTLSRQSACWWRWGCQPYVPVTLYCPETLFFCFWYSFLLEAE